jgi:hypothetical protein
MVVDISGMFHRFDVRYKYESSDLYGTLIAVLAIDKYDAEKKALEILLHGRSDFVTEFDIKFLEVKPTENWLPPPEDETTAI